jgi:hypothetical protein
MERHIHAPDQEWLTAREAATWLNITEPTFKLMVKEGQIPPGKRWSKKTLRWHWETILAVSILMKTGFLPLKEVTGEEEGEAL